MRKNSNVLLLLVAISILVAGCQLIGGKERGGIPDSSSAFEGREGLALSFFKDAPPEKLIPNSEFRIAVLLENKGAADISCDDNPESCGFFLVFSKEPITGITPPTGNLKDALEVIDDRPRLLGKESYISGGRAAMELAANSGEPDETTMSTVTVNACYPYKTSLSASVCVQTAHYTVPDANRACRLSALSFSSQGAPVAVTKIEQESILSGEYVKPRLKIYVSEVGKGTVLAGDTQSLKEACKSETANIKEIVGKVTVTEATISGAPLNCQGKTITLTGTTKKDYMECLLEDSIFNAGASNNMVAPLKLILSYGYQTAISKEVEIEVLDSPPKIKRFSIIPEKPSPSEQLSLLATAEDDSGLKEIQLLNSKGELISKHDCDGEVSCSSTFRENAPAKAGETYLYKAMAVDTAGKPSDISMASGIVKGMTVSIAVPETAPAGSDAQISASATSTGTLLKSLELVSVLDGKESIIATYDCKLQKTCSNAFKVKAPANGEVGFYNARATDSKGSTAESETKTVTGSSL